MKNGNITIHNIMHEMRVDCDGGNNNDLEIQYYDKDSCEMKKIRSTIFIVKMNRDEERDIEIEWE